MAKNRELSSIEHGLAEAIKNLKAEVIEQATGKSISFIRKCSDPDLDQQLDHNDAIKIDKVCIESGLNPYLLRSHEFIILKELKKTKVENKSMNELLIQFTISLGKLLDRIKSAKNPKGDKGEDITSAEKKEIFDAFHEFENKILKIKTSIDKE
tara:strand:+ start:792 stop:1253 length:462 start_codon:yes stop_codon:yes gene_type:complete